MPEVQDQPLKLRGRLVASHQIPITTADANTFKKQLAATITKAPALFKNAPCVLDISALDCSAFDELPIELIDTCRSAGLVPYALTSAHSQHQALAEPSKLAWLDFKNNKAGQKASEKSATFSTKIITTPIRSGQQVYAKDAHLVVMNQVSAGAEVAADGNIHVYGALRGRAIAGASGNPQGEIVCQQMQAELISIAGIYLVQDDFPQGEGAAHCHLTDDSISIDYL